MKKGFTMIELIFVIVILGILASVAIPKLAATRDDAKAATIKTDIGTAMNAIPAWYQGQKDVRIQQAMSIDTSVWVKGTNEKYVWSDENQACVTIAIWDVNSTSGDGTLAVENTDYNATTGTWNSSKAVGEPMLRIIRTDDNNASPSGAICKTIWNTMGLSEQNISLSGKKVKW